VRKQTRIRLMAASVLMMALGFIGSADRNAIAGCGISPACANTPCRSCEHVCMPLDEYCQSGQGGPNCEATVARCYECCVWL